MSHTPVVFCDINKRIRAQSLYACVNDGAVGVAVAYMLVWVPCLCGFCDLYGWCGSCGWCDVCDLNGW